MPLQKLMDAHFRLKFFCFIMGLTDTKFPEDLSKPATSRRLIFVGRKANPKFMMIPGGGHGGRGGRKREAIKGVGRKSFLSE